MRATAIDLLANYNSNASATARREMLGDSNALVRLAAVRVLPGDDPELLVSNLASVINDPDA